jgi:hypothetical protein
MSDQAVKQLPAHAVYYVVPAGTHSFRCSGVARGGSCSAPIYFIKNPKTGNRVPIDCDVPNGQRPSANAAVDERQIDAFGAAPAEAYDGRGVSHYFTCPDADLFTKKGGR